MSIQWRESCESSYTFHVYQVPTLLTRELTTSCRFIIEGQYVILTLLQSPLEPAACLWADGNNSRKRSDSGSPMAPHLASTPALDALSTLWGYKPPDLVLVKLVITHCKQNILPDYIYT